MVSFKEKIFASTLFLWRLETLAAFKGADEGIELKKLVQGDIKSAVISIRNADLLKERLEAGQAAYWVKMNKQNVHMHWYAYKHFYIWDIRTDILIPEGTCYLFDVFTDSAYRKRGLFKRALANSLKKENMFKNKSVFILTQKHNVAANASFHKLNFRRLATISLFQVPPLRWYRIIANSSQKNLVKIMGLHNMPIRLYLDSVRMVK